MTSKRITMVLGQLGLVQVRYVSPVRRGSAQGLAGRVYEQVEREFGVLAPSLALLSPAPQVLAASWLMLRETLLVTRQVDRAAKETVATTVSLGNTCPWCVTVHSTMASGLTGGLVLADRPAEAITHTRLRVWQIANGVSGDRPKFVDDCGAHGILEQTRTLCHF